MLGSYSRKDLKKAGEIATRLPVRKNSTGGIENGKSYKENQV